jgi:hypothetical protein
MLIGYVTILIAIATSIDAHVWSNRTVILGYESISNSSMFLYDDILIEAMNARFSGLDMPFGSLTYNASLHKMSEGLNFVKRDTKGPTNDIIGVEYGFLIPPGTFVIYHRIFGRHLALSRGEVGELLMVAEVGSEDDPLQILPYISGPGFMVTNEGITSTHAFMGMFRVLNGTGIFEPYGYGRVRVNGMTTINPLSLINGTQFKTDCIYLAKFEYNETQFGQRYFEWPHW